MAIPSFDPGTFIKQYFHSIVSLTIRGLSVVAGFIVTVLIGRMFGPEANGHYALITQTAMFLSVVAVGGIDLAVTRKFSAAVAKKIPLERRSLLKVTGYSMLFSGGVIVVLLLGGTSLMKLLFEGEVPNDAITVLIIIMLSRTLTRMLSAVLRSQKAYAWGQSVEVLLIPSVVLICMALGLASDVDQVLWITALVGIIVGIGAFATAIPYSSSAPGALHVPMRDILKVAVPLWGVAIFLNIADWYGLATASAVLSVYEAGLYRVALQIASVLGIVTMGLFSIFSPQFAEAHASEDMVKVAQLAGSATRLSVLFCLPVAILIFVFASPILRIFGPEFEQATTVLRVIVAGQAIYTMTGPSGLILAMTGHERINLIQTIGSTTLLLITAPAAAQYGGLLGIAICMSLVVIARNMASIYSVRRLTGINVLAGTIKPVKGMPRLSRHKDGEIETETPSSWSADSPGPLQ